MILGIGIDIIEINRIEKIINRWGDNFLNHVFNTEEIEYSRKFINPAQHFAARFAAKEAIYKALKNQINVTWKDITILNDAAGRPYCKLNDKTFNDKILISLSHSDNYAVANAIITK